MRYFKKLLNIPVVILPECGRVHDVDLLQGEEYAKYVPFYLYETDANGRALSSEFNTAPVTVKPVSPPPATHVSSPIRPAPPPALQQAWENRRPTQPLGLADALATALSQTVPLPEETPKPAPADSPKTENTATMEARSEESPKRKRGRPRKMPPA